MFTGDPGTGRTTVALRVADLLRQLGHLRRGHVVQVTRDDLVGQFVGHTGPRTRDALARAMGGVQFVDEAYALHRPGNERDYGGEAVETLILAMEDHHDDLVVVVVGHADRMSEFLSSNPGLASRVTHHIDFPLYTQDELVEIGTRMLTATGLGLVPDAVATFAEYVRLRREQPRFGHARSIRNALDRARLRQAKRLLTAGGRVGRADLATLTAADFLASRVFTGSHPHPS